MAGVVRHFVPCCESVSFDKLLSLEQEKEKVEGWSQSVLIHTWREIQCEGLKLVDSCEFTGESQFSFLLTTLTKHEIMFLRLSSQANY